MYEETLFEMGTERADKTMLKVADAIIASKSYSLVSIDKALLDSEPKWADRRSSHVGKWVDSIDDDTDCVHLQVALADVREQKETSGFLGIFGSSGGHVTEVVIEIQARKSFNGSMIVSDSAAASYKRLPGVAAGAATVSHPPQKSKLVGPFTRTIIRFALDSIPKYLTGGSDQTNDD